MSENSSKKYTTISAEGEELFLSLLWLGKQRFPTRPLLITLD
jgi:hypothetical protein